MRARSFIAFTLVTLVLLAGAIYAFTSQRGTTQLPTGGAAAFPELNAKVNDAAEIAIVNFKGTLTLKRQGDGWILVERQGYPVPFDRVKELLVALTQLKLLEPKTKEPERYERLAVQDIGPKESEAVSVTVKDASGEVLAAAIVGKRNETLYGKAGGGTYLRRAGEAQTWLAEGLVKVGVTHKDWVDKIIVDLEKKDVRRVAMTHPDEAESFVGTKENPEQANLKLVNAPEDKKLKSEREIDGIVEIVNDLDLEDVKKAADVEWPSPGDRFEFVTWDGLVVKGEIVSPEKYVYWAKFEAGVAPEGKDLEKAKAEAAKINARVGGWAYEIAAGYGEKLSKKKSELFEEEKKPES